VADKRGQALASAFNGRESLVASREQVALEPTEQYPDPVYEPAAESALASVPDAVRMAALSELQTMTLKRRRWWQRS
jgi:hypothetical protein